MHTDGIGMEEGGVPQAPQQPQQKKKAAGYANEILYGIINAIVGAPTMISFAAIVYQVPRSSPSACFPQHPASILPCCCYFKAWDQSM